MSSNLAERHMEAETRLLNAQAYELELLNGPPPTIGNIGWAIAHMRRGDRVTRRGWNGPGQFLALQVPDEHSKMRKPYIYISPVDGELVPWLASQTDILATDWEVVA